MRRIKTQPNSTRYSLYIKKRWIIWFYLVAVPIVGADIIIWQPEILQYLTIDTLLALFALFWVFSAWFQGFVNVRGLAYQLSTDDMRKQIDQHFKTTVKGKFAMFIKGGYWGALFFMLVCAVLIINSVIFPNHDVDKLVESNQQMINQLSSEINALSEKIDTYTARNQENISILVQKLDELITQMEVNNASTTPSK